NHFQQKNSSNARKNTIGAKAPVHEVKKKSLVEKPVLASTYNQDFRPKVLVRGSGSIVVGMSSLSEDVPIKNSFQVLDDEQDFIDVMETGIYPTLNVRAKWSLAQINFFYSNCHKYRLDPSYEEDDVATEDGDMAKEMRAEDVDLDACNCNNRQFSKF
ncbi:hypothetical protein Tco_0230458, partial [Tanacetum coccineum]